MASKIGDTKLSRFSIEKYVVNNLDRLHNSNKFSIIFDLTNNRIFYHLPVNDDDDDNRFFLMINFSAIKSIDYDENDKTIRIYFIKQNFELFYTMKKTNYFKFKGQNRFVKRIISKNLYFNYNFKKTINIYCNYFKSDNHLIHLKRNEGKRMHNIINSYQIYSMSLLAGLNLADHIKKRKLDQISQSNDDDVKKKLKTINKSCFISNQHNYSDPNKLIEIELPCGHGDKFKKSLVELADLILVCPDAECNLHFKYSFCLNKFLIYQFYMHCKHSNKCTNFVNCKICKN